MRSKQGNVEPESFQAISNNFIETLPHRGPSQGAEKRTPSPDESRCSIGSYDHKKLTIVYSNLDTFLNKKTEIINMIDNDHPDILTFTETLDKKKPCINRSRGQNCWLCNLPRYKPTKRYSYLC